MVPSASRIAVLLLLLGAHAASAASITGGPGLMDILNKRFQVPATSSSSKTADLNATTAKAGTTKATVQQYKEEGYEHESYGHEEHGHMVEKEVCLQETKKKTCGASTTAVAWTSEFACCQDNEYSNSYGHDNNGLRDRFTTSQNTIGSCEWAYAVTPAAAVSTNINRIGLASAVCFFGPESHECGGPFCERLMMSLEGPIYSVSNAYSYYGDTATNEAGCSGTTLPWGARMAGRQQSLGATIGRFVVQAPQEVEPSSLEPQPAEHAAGLEYYNDRENPERTVYVGGAYIITGLVTSMAGQRKEKWDEGTFEYTVDYDMARQVTTGLDANIPWVRDKTYKFTFLKHGGSY